MFQSKNNTGTLASIISKDVEINGDINISGDILIYGKVTGNIFTSEPAWFLYLIFFLVIVINLAYLTSIYIIFS